MKVALYVLSSLVLYQIVTRPAGGYRVGMWEVQVIMWALPTRGMSSWAVTIVLYYPLCHSTDTMANAHNFEKAS